MTKNILDESIHNLICQSRYKILKKNEIIEKYLIFIHNIDHMIVLYDKIICIGTNWSDITQNIYNIDNFIKNVNNVYKKENYKKCIGIYITKSPIPKNCLELIKLENDKQINYYTFINNNNIQKILNDLTCIFYSNEIFFYEQDGTAIMIE